MTGCHPAILLIDFGRDDDEYPHPSDVTETVVESLEAEGWTSTADFVVDVREGTFPIQHEFPPEPPIETTAIAVALAQTEATLSYGYPGPFRVVLEGLHQEYPDMELHIDAVEV